MVLENKQHKTWPYEDVMDIYDVTIIDENVTDEELIKFALDEGLPTDMENVSNKWFVFSYKYGLEKGFDPITAKSFASIATDVTTYTRINYGTYEYFNEYEIYNDVLEISNIFDSDTLLESQRKRFNITFDIYNRDIENYAKKTERLQFRISYNMLQKFMNIEGKNKADKLRVLLSVYNTYMNLDEEDLEELLEIVRSEKK